MNYFKKIRYILFSRILMHRCLVEGFLINSLLILIKVMKTEKYF